MYFNETVFNECFGKRYDEVIFYVKWRLYLNNYETETLIPDINPPRIENILSSTSKVQLTAQSAQKWDTNAIIGT